MKSTWSPDAGLPIQRPRVLKTIHNNTSAEIDCVDASTLSHNAQVKAPFMRIQHFLSPDVSADTHIKVKRNGVEHLMKARYNCFRFEVMHFAILPRGVTKDLAPRQVTTSGDSFPLGHTTDL
eukprot:2129370-Karenia_brevis.AAC.1